MCNRRCDTHLVHPIVARAALCPSVVDRTHLCPLEDDAIPWQGFKRSTVDLVRYIARAVIIVVVTAGSLDGVGLTSFLGFSRTFSRIARDAPNLATVARNVELV